MIKKMQEKRLKVWKNEKAVEKLEAEDYGKKIQASMIVWDQQKDQLKKQRKIRYKLIQLILLNHSKKTNERGIRGVRSKILVETNASAQWKRF